MNKKAFFVANIVSILVLGACSTFYKYNASQFAVEGNAPIEVQAAFDPENYFIDTKIINNGKTDVLLVLDESTTVIDGETVKLVQTSAVRALSVTGAQAPIPIPSGGMVSLEISNAKQTNGNTYDTWFKAMWSSDPKDVLGRAINATLVFKDQKGKVSKKVLRTTLSAIGKKEVI